MDANTHEKRYKPQTRPHAYARDRSHPAKLPKADSEKVIEKKLSEGVKKLGGLALKWVSPGFTGVPDRKVLLPGGLEIFVETKSTGEQLTDRQRFVHRQLRELGFEVHVIDTLIGLREFLDHVKSLIC